MSHAPLVVGLLGHNGMIGSKILAELTPLHQDKTITLIVLHRASSDLSKVDEGIEKRVIDLEAEDGPAYDAALQGIQVLISAVASAALKAQLSLVPALLRSNTLQTFIPSHYGHHWSEEELNSMTFLFIKDKENVEVKLKEAGVPLTTVKSGLIADFAFKFSIGQWNPKGNQVFVYRDSQNTKIPLTSSTYLAKVIVVLLGQPIESVVNHTFVAIEDEPTNAEITKMLTAIHGKETELVEFDDAQVNENCVSSHPLVSLGAAVLRKSGMGWWDIPEAQRVEPIGWETEGVEAQLRNHIAA